MVGLSLNIIEVGTAVDMGGLCGAGPGWLTEAPCKLAEMARHSSAAAAEMLAAAWACSMSSFVAVVALALMTSRT